MSGGLELRASNGMQPKVMKDKVLIIGLGNSLAGDDGFGPYIVNYLQEQPIPYGVKVMEGGTDAFALLTDLERAEYVILLDVVQSAGEPGTIYRIPLSQLRFRGVGLSQHQVSLLDLYQLSYTKWQLNLPEGVLIAVEVGEIDLFTETLSLKLLEQVPVVAERVLSEANRHLDVELYTI